MPLLEEDPHDWFAVAVRPDGTKFVLNHWLPVTITRNFTGTTMSYTTPNMEEASDITPLMTDVLLYRDGVLWERMRVVDDRDQFTANGHTVTFTCASYQHLLARRILHTAWDGRSGDQHDLGWDLIAHTQARPGGDLGITRAAPAAGKIRSRTINRGVSIMEAIDKIATMDDGFDWWIDENLQWHAQTPRRERDLKLDLGWGQGIQEIDRDGAADVYAAYVLAVGSQQVVTIPGGGTYQPPVPQIAEDPTRPYGLWEKTLNFPDVVTEASLLEKATWELNEASSLRISYRCLMEPGIWTPDMGPGDKFRLRIESPPRISVSEIVRVEEVQIGLRPEGAEDVTLMVRSEEGTNTPLSGRSKQFRHASAEFELGALFGNLRRDVRVTQQHMGTQW